MQITDIYSHKGGKEYLEKHHGDELKDIYDAVENINFIESLSNRALMDSYFINYFPYEFRITQLLNICLSVLFMSVIFSYFPAAKAARLKPVNILRHE